MAKHTVNTQNDEAVGDFDSILDRSAEEVKEPGRAPSGPWVLKCTKVFFFKTKKEDLEADPSKPLGSVTFIHTPHDPQEGVDPDLVESGEWRGKKIRTKRNIKENTDDAQLVKLAEMHGVSREGRTTKQMLEACVDRFVRGSVSVYSYTNRDGELVVENQIGNFLPVGAE